MFSSAKSRLDIIEVGNQRTCFLMDDDTIHVLLKVVWQKGASPINEEGELSCATFLPVFQDAFAIDAVQARKWTAQIHESSSFLKLNPSYFHVHTSRM